MSTNAGDFRRRFDRPIFIVSSPRSGSSLLFQTLARAPDVFTIGGESHQLIEALPGLHPRLRGWSSNRLDAADATPALAEELSRRFYLSLRDRKGHPPTGTVRLIEKTPKNSLRVPFLHAAFPDARFVFLYRDPRETLSSMIEAWTSGGFRTYPALPDWPAPPWSLLLVPGWRALAGRPLAEIVAHQWATTMTCLLDDLETLPPARIHALSYDALLAAPQRTVTVLCDGLELGWDATLGDTLPLSPTVVSQPAPEKWRRDADAIAAIWPIVEAADARARAALKRYAR
ncbi:sulfotransferase family protein [Sphingomonas sp. GB1N7]|uniref:sulfotransferase family protein n=1 Tax=Parasphingomonas caseinilytica TaxID=3096158 RepID=UPI002FC8AF8D